MVETIVIIGAGQAGGQVAQSLRRAGYDGRLVLIGDEPHPPYQRPPLSKSYLTGQLSADRLALLPQQFFADNAIECLFGQRVEALDIARRRLVLADGAELAFDKTVIATGSRPRALPLAGADLDGVLPLRAIGDVERLRSFIRPGRRLLIIGAGFIGLEVAAMARKLTLDVTVIEAAPRVMARTAPEVISRHFEDLHRANGVALRLGCGVRSISSTRGGGLTVATDQGGFEADCVLVGVGGQPNVELARAAGLAIDNGIVVDGFCQTSAEGVFAAGDCTSFPSARYGRRLRLESVQNAIDQAKAAALAMLGQGEAYDPIPWFWSDQYDTKLQIAGLGAGADQYIVRGTPASGSFAVAHLAAGRLIALDAVNRPRDYMEARRSVPTSLPVDLDRLADPDVPLSAALAQ